MSDISSEAADICRAMADWVRDGNMDFKRGTETITSLAQSCKVAADKHSCAISFSMDHDSNEAVTAVRVTWTTGSTDHFLSYSGGTRINYEQAERSPIILRT